jgi:aspartate kinase
MRVMKFGGTSIGDAESILRVASIIEERAGEGAVLVFSATGSTTDDLDRAARLAAEGQLPESLEVLSEVRRIHERMARELMPESEGRIFLLGAMKDHFSALERWARGISVLEDLSNAVLDRFLQKGELISTLLLFETFRSRGLRVRWMDARNMVVTNDRHGGAEPFMDQTFGRCRRALLPLLSEGSLPLTQGFIARTEGGGETTLGRGGSDYSASLIGAALGADEIEIWTDVDGILTADPSLVPEARNIPAMSFQEASELSFFGARVLHPKTLLPAVERAIPVRILNTRRPSGVGTLILAEPPSSGPGIKSIAYKESMTVVNLVSSRMFKAKGYLASIFDVFERYGLIPDAVATSAVSVAVALLDAPPRHALDELRSLGAVTVRTGQAVVCVVGEGLKEIPGAVGQVFEELKDLRIAMVSQGGSEINLAFVVAEEALPCVVRRLHRRFFESDGAQEAHCVETPNGEAAHGC